MAKVSKTRIIDPVLTELATGYSNATCVGTELFPVVFVEKEGAIIPKFGKGAFKLYKTSRAPGAKSNRVKHDPADTIDVVLREYDLTDPIDYREDAESLFDEQERSVQFTSDALDLDIEKEIADLVQNPATYAATNKKALTNTSCWDQTGGKPITDIKDGIQAIRRAIGRKPNTLFLGAETFNILAENAEILEKIKNHNEVVVTEDDLARIFKVEKVVVGEAIYQDDNGTMHDVWGDVAILAYVARDSKSYNTPTAGYLLRKKGFRIVDTWDEEGGKIINVRTTDIRKPAVVGADAMYLISNTKK